MKGCQVNHAQAQCARTVSVGEQCFLERQAEAIEVGLLAADACRRWRSRPWLSAVLAVLDLFSFVRKTEQTIAFAFFAFVTPFFVEYLHFSTCSALL